MDGIDANLVRKHTHTNYHPPRKTHRSAEQPTAPDAHGRRAYAPITIPCGPPSPPKARWLCTASSAVRGRVGLSSLPSLRQDRRMSPRSSSSILSPGATGPALRVATAASSAGLTSRVSGP